MNSRFNQLHIKRRLRKILGKDIIYVFGDSHAGALQHEIFVVQGVGAATAYRLQFNNTTVKAKQQIYQYINKFPKQNKTLALFIFGEIDCRIHIYKFHKETGASIDSAIIRTVSSYEKFLIEFKKQNPTFEILLLNILPPGEQKNIYKHNFYATRKVQLKITKKMNRILKNVCVKNNYYFIEVFNELIDIKGNRLNKYILDSVHYNQDIIPLIISALKQQTPFNI